MRQKLLTLLSWALLSLCFFTCQATANELITLEIPEAVIAEATTAILPLQIDAHSKSIEGDITIIDISELQLTRDHLACRLHLRGDKLAILTEIAGQEIRLNVGSLELDFKTKALIRFDAAKQILYIKPIVDDVTDTGNGSGDNIGQALIAILNGSEFPVTMQELDPLIARAGSKIITINTTIADIRAKKQAIQLNLAATVSAKKK